MRNTGPLHPRFRMNPLDTPVASNPVTSPSGVGGSLDEYGRPKEYVKPVPTPPENEV